MRLFYKIK